MFLHTVKPQIGYSYRLLMSLKYMVKEAVIYMLESTLILIIEGYYLSYLKRGYLLEMFLCVTYVL